MYIDLDQFTKSFTPTTSYLLGYLWADGWINNNPRKNRNIKQQMVGIQLQLDDFKHIEPFLRQTGEWSIKYLPPRKETHKPIGRAYTYNHELTSFLIENDYISKSILSACKILSKIPDNLKSYWFLGLVDGDGMIKIGKHREVQLAVYSSYDQDWTYIKSLYEKLGINYSIKQRIRDSGDGSEIIITNLPDIIKFGDFIYNNEISEKLALPRKREKYLFLRNKLNKIYSNRITTGIHSYHLKNNQTKYKVLVKFRKITGPNNVNIGHFNSLDDAIQGKRNYILDNFGEKEYERYYGCKPITSFGTPELRDFHSHLQPKIST